MQGQGPTTQRKQVGFASIFAASLKISKAPPVATFPYWHIDLNAGCGVNEAAGCDGSPLVFIQQAVIQERRANAYFCDVNPETVAQLQERINARKLPTGLRVTCTQGDNAEVLGTIAEEIAGQENARYAVGTVLCDPNGPRKGFPFEELIHFTARFQRIDVVLNLNLRVLRMGLAAAKSSRVSSAKGFQDWPQCRQIIDSLSKQHWLIRNPGRTNRDYFATLVGRNKEATAYRDIGFYPLNSTTGQQIVQEMKRVQAEQQMLPFEEGEACS